MARVLGSYSVSIYEKDKKRIFEFLDLGLSYQKIVTKLLYGSKQGLACYLKRLKDRSGEKTTKEALQIKQSYSLEEKVVHTKKRIKEFYEKMDSKVYVSFSGGKDSTVLLHLVRSMYKDVEAVFCDTTNEYKEILEFVRKTPNVKTLKPKINFMQIVQNYGFPLVSKKVARTIHDLKNPTPNNANSRRMYLEGVGSKGQNLSSYKLSKKWYKLIDAPFNLTSKCCDILKKDPFSIYEKQSNKKPFIGTNASESSFREKNYIKYGCNIFGDKPKSRPLSIWSDQDIWQYIKQHKLDYSSIYNDIHVNGTIVSAETRTGCAYCAFGAHLEDKDNNRFTRLKLRKPKQYEKIMSLKNGSYTFSQALSFVLES